MGTVMSVTGPVSSDELGLTLMHEHLYLDLTRDVPGGNNLMNNPDLAYSELIRFKEAGGTTVVDQTTGGLRGHDHDLLPVKHAVAVKALAERTGLNIILGAGWYREPYYEQRLYRMRTNEIAEELIRDISEGIDGTDVRAGLLGEIGTHFTWISPVEERVLRAVARAHHKTGVSIATHAVNSPVGLDQLDILTEEGVDARRVVIGHCQLYPHHEYHAEIARRGAFVAFDRLGTQSPFEHEADMRMIGDMVKAGLTGHVLFSQDVCHRADYVAYGGKGYTYVSGDMKGDLAQIGVTEEDFHRITVDNPRRALTGEE